MKKSRVAHVNKLLALALLLISSQGCGWIAIGGGAVAIASSGGGGGGGGVQSTAPQVEIAAAQSTNQQLGVIPVSFTITDAESDKADAVVEFSIASGAFQACTAAPASPALTELESSPDGVAHQFLWDASADLQNAEEASVVLRIRVNELGNTDLEDDDATSNFRVGNIPPDISNIRVLAANNTISGQVVVEFTVTDQLGDEVGINSYQYSKDGGTTWVELTDAAITGGIKKGLALATMQGQPTTADFTWDTKLEPGLQGEVINNRLLVRLTPQDTYEQVTFVGASGQTATPASVDNNALPQAAILFDGLNDVSAPVTLPFLIRDLDNDDVRVLIQWKDASDSNFIDLEAELIAEGIIDVSDPTRDSISDQAVLDDLLSDMALRQRLRIITEVENRKVESRVFAGGTLNTLNLKELVGRVNPADLVGARVSLDGGVTSTAVVTSFRNGMTDIDPALTSAIDGQSVTLTVDLPTQKSSMFRGTDGSASGNGFGALYEITWNAIADLFGPVNAQLRIVPIDLRVGSTDESFRSDRKIQGQVREAVPDLPTIASGATQNIQVDLDNDGDLDLLVLSRSLSNGSVQSAISVIVNDGGQYQSATQFGTLNTAMAPILITGDVSDIAARDFNGDGLRDIVVTTTRRVTTNGNQLLIFFQQFNSNGNVSFDRDGASTGTGTFLSIPLNSFQDAMANPVFDNFVIEAMAVGDLNGDGGSDFVWALKDIDNSMGHVRENKVVVFYNNNPFSPVTGPESFFFETLENFSVTLNDTNAILDEFGVGGLKVGDANQDGLDDLVIHYFSPLDSTRRLAVHIQPQGSIDDSTGSTNPDIPTDITTQTTAVTGGGFNLELFPRAFTPELFQDLFEFVIDDLDFVGFSNIVVASKSGNEVVIYKIDLTPGSEVISELAFFPTDSGPEFVAVGDIDGDGLKDIVCSNPDSRTVNLFRQLDSAASPQDMFVEVEGSPFAAPRGNRGVSVGQQLFGNLSVVLANTNSGLTFFEKPNGSVIQSIDDAIQPPPDSAGLTIADLNQDGRPEVIFSSTTFDDSAGSIIEKGILTVQSQDEFGNYQELNVELDVGDDPGALESGDMDGDSIADILLISPEKSEFRVAFIGPQNDLPAVLALDIHSTVDPNGKVAEPVDLEIGDLNGDGIDEAVVLIGDGVPCLNIFERGTGRTVQLRTGGAVALPQFSQNEVSDLVIGDVSRDGREDIIVCGGTQVLAYLQRSDGTFDFTSPTIVLSDGEVNFQSVALADLNGDGFLDVAAVAQYPFFTPDEPIQMTLQYVFQEDLSDSQVTKLFDTPFSLGRFDGFAGILSAGDLNNDGLADLAFQINNDTIRVQFQSEQQGKVTFSTGKNFSIGQGLTKFIIRDMNRDGLEDLVVYSSSIFDDGIGFDDGANRIIILQQD